MTLLVHTSSLGDVILSTSVILGIKRIYSGAYLWIITTPIASLLVVCDQLLAGVLTEHRYFSGLTASGS
jgi:ADP-heptose:LPS heptosyltransferase